MKTIKKILFISSAIVLLAVGCNKPADQRGQTTNPAQTQPNYDKQVFTEPPMTPGQGDPDTIGVGQKVVGSSVKELGEIYFVSKETTGLSLLKMAHKLETKSYEGIGEMVIAIDDIKADSKHFWEFFVNGKSSNVGASSYKLQNKDEVLWKLSEIK